MLEEDCSELVVFKKNAYENQLIRCGLKASLENPSSFCKGKIDFDGDDKKNKVE